MVSARFPTLFLRKHYSARTVFLICESLVLLSSLLAIGYYFIYGTPTMVEVILLVALQIFGFSGLAILTANNIMLVGEEKKGTNILMA